MVKNLYILITTILIYVKAIYVINIPFSRYLGRPIPFEAFKRLYFIVNNPTSRIVYIYVIGIS